MLTDYKGPSNCNDIFQHLVGEEIKAAFMGDDGKIYVGSGDAFVVGGSMGTYAVYWREQKGDVDMKVRARRASIEKKLAELRDLPGVDLL
jgi:hypothetical protein